MPFSDYAVVFPWGNPPRAGAPGKKLYLRALKHTEVVPEYMGQLGGGTIPENRTHPILLGIFVLHHGQQTTPSQTTHSSSNGTRKYLAHAISVLKSGSRPPLPSQEPSVLEKKPDFGFSEGKRHTSPTSDYDDVVAGILESAPTAVATEYRRTSDPRILFPYATPASKKVLTDWLERHYFIPKTPPRVQPKVASGYKEKVTGSRVNPFDYIGDSVALDDRSNQLLKQLNPPHHIASALADAKVPARLRQSAPGTSSNVAGPSKPKKYIPSPHIAALLAESNQPEPYDFSDFVATIPFDESIHGERVDQSPLSLYKVGEASFSEVFAIGNVVLKIIPIAIDGQVAAVSSGDVMWPSISSPEDVTKEIRATKLMGSVHPTFIKLLR